MITQIRAGARSMGIAIGAILQARPHDPGAGCRIPGYPAPPDPAMLEVLRYRDLVRELVVRDLKVRYRRSAIGFLWTMLQPLFNMLVLEMVFSALFRFNVQNYPVFALAGIL